MRFVLHELLRRRAGSTDLPGYEDATPELIDSVLEEAARFAQSVLRRSTAPATRRAAATRTASCARRTGFKEAYATFARGRLDRRSPPTRSTAARACRKLVNLALEEMFCQRQPRLRHLSRPQPRRLPMRWRSTATDELQATLPAQARRRHVDRHHVPDRAALRHRPRPDPHQGRAGRATAATASPAPRSSSPPASTT